MIVPWPLQKDHKYLVMRTKRFLELMGNKSKSEGQESQHLMEEQNEEEAAA